MKPWIGCEIKLLRTQLGWSRVDMAKKLNCSPLKVVKLEEDEVIPTRDEKGKLEALSLHVSQNVESHQKQTMTEAVMSERGLEQIHVDDIEDDKLF